jgi:hypothetical protein
MSYRDGGSETQSPPKHVGATVQSRADTYIYTHIRTLRRPSPRHLSNLTTMPSYGDDQNVEIFSLRPTIHMPSIAYDDGSITCMSLSLLTHEELTPEAKGPFTSHTPASHARPLLWRQSPGAPRPRQ